jgi:hypothetical protein
MQGMNPRRRLTVRKVERHITDVRRQNWQNAPQLWLAFAVLHDVPEFALARRRVMDFDLRTAGIIDLREITHRLLQLFVAFVLFLLNHARPAQAITAPPAPRAGPTADYDIDLTMSFQGDQFPPNWFLCSRVMPLAVEGSNLLACTVSSCFIAIYITKKFVEEVERLVGGGGITLASILEALPICNTAHLFVGRGIDSAAEEARIVNVPCK